MLITGGTGLLGKALVNILETAELPYTITSRNPPVDPFPKSRWQKLDLATGNGLKEALKRIDTIFHLASDTKHYDPRIDLDGTQSLLEAAKRENVEHFIYISIVGVDKIPIKYYRIKLQAEKLIEASGLPYTILRATQFHDFVDKTLKRFLKFPIGILPKKVKIQPIDTAVVAKVLFELYHQGAEQAILNIGGPQVLEVGALARDWLQAKSLRKPVFNLPLFGELGRSLRAGGLTCREKADHSISWKAWLQQQATVSA